MASNGSGRLERINLAVGLLVFGSMVAVAIVAGGFREETEKSLRDIAQSNAELRRAQLETAAESAKAKPKLTIEFTKIKDGVAQKILVHVHEGDPAGKWEADLADAAKRLEAFDG